MTSQPSQYNDLSGVLILRRSLPIYFESTAGNIAHTLCVFLTSGQKHPRFLISSSAHPAHLARLLERLGKLIWGGTRTSGHIAKRNADGLPCIPTTCDYDQRWRSSHKEKKVSSRELWTSGKARSDAFFEDIDLIFYFKSIHIYFFFIYVFRKRNKWIRNYTSALGFKFY